MMIKTLPIQLNGYSKNGLLILFFLITTACSSIGSHKQAVSSVNETGTVINEASNKCRLPSQIRRISRQFTFLEPGRIVQTTVSDCKTRGGTMVANI